MYFLCLTVPLPRMTGFAHAQPGTIGPDVRMLEVLEAAAEIHSKFWLNHDSHILHGIVSYSMPLLLLPQPFCLLGHSSLESRAVLSTLIVIFFFVQNISNIFSSYTKTQAIHCLLLQPKNWLHMNRTRLLLLLPEVTCLHHVNKVIRTQWASPTPTHIDIHVLSAPFDQFITSFYHAMQKVLGRQPQKSESSV